MKTQELLNMIANGEDSKHQFKSDIKHTAALSAEMAAFANSQGGYLLIGVNDDGSLSGLTNYDLKRLNQMIANAASQNVRPPISPATENISLPEGKVIVLSIERGLSKPYMDSHGYIWMKSGADKRRITAREELQRIFQEASLVHADAVPVKNTSIADVDTEFFDACFAGIFEESVARQPLSRGELMENMNLMNGGQLNISGVLLFAQKPQWLLPTCVIKAVVFPGVDITDQTYLDSRDINGRLSDVFQQTRGFILTNIHHIQNNQSVNSLGQPEIPRIVLEELIANALIHRDYFISAPIKVLIFANRVEIISPGHLPNNLTIAKIKFGNSCVRNPILASFASKVLPYRGLGSGILRALKAYPDIELTDDREANWFKVTIPRK